MNKAAKVEQSSPGECLAQVQERFKHWRKIRLRGQHIPQHLWVAAVGLAKEYGLCRVANELSINHDRLKKHLAQAECALQGSKPDMQFVELTDASIPRLLTQSPCECVIEMRSERGAKMRVELNGNGLAGLAGICNTFWSAA